MGDFKCSTACGDEIKKLALHFTYLAFQSNTKYIMYQKELQQRVVILLLVYDAVTSFRIREFETSALPLSQISIVKQVYVCFLTFSLKQVE